MRTSQNRSSGRGCSLNSLLYLGQQTAMVTLPIEVLSASILYFTEYDARNRAAMTENNAAKSNDDSHQEQRRKIIRAWEMGRITEAHLKASAAADWKTLSEFPRGWSKVPQLNLKGTEVLRAEPNVLDVDSPITG